MVAWTSKTEEFLRGEIPITQQLAEETNEMFERRQATSCLPPEKFWCLICCACGKPTHDMKEGSCFSPQAAAHADAVVRTAFVVDTSKEEKDGKHSALCLKVATNTQSVLTQLQEIAEKHKMEGRGIAQVYPGVMWGEGHRKLKNKLEICDANLFALELSLTQGKQPDNIELYGCKVYGTDHDMGGCERKYGAEPRVQVQLSLQLANESTLNVLPEGKDELIVVMNHEECQMQIDPDGTMSLTGGDLDQHIGKQMRAFYGDEGEKSSQSR